MRCILCGCLEDRVIDSRTARDGAVIRRRRVCANCGYRFTTYEQIERTELMVIKKNGSSEPLNREKILRGLTKACEKRPVSMDRLDHAVDLIMEELHHEHKPQIEAKEIGQKVMNQLYDLDPVAYIRYVSVYREFQNVDEFIKEISDLGKRKASEKRASSNH